MLKEKEMASRLRTKDCRWFMTAHGEATSLSRCDLRACMSGMCDECNDFKIVCPKIIVFLEAMQGERWFWGRRFWNRYSKSSKVILHQNHRSPCMASVRRRSRFLVFSQVDRIEVCFFICQVSFRVLIVRYAAQVHVAFPRSLRLNDTQKQGKSFYQQSEI
jgi:hypothetical protein